MATAEDTLDSIVARADFLMYASKAKGKNCVTIDCKERVKGVRGAGVQPMLFPPV